MRKVTIKDVARFAGVGVSTVSRVINNHQDVNDETRKKVLETIETYKYTPNNSARSLKIVDTMNIGVLVKGISNTFYVKMLEVIEKEIVDKGYSVVLRHVSIDENELTKAAELAVENKVCGIIFLGGNYLSKENDVLRINVPFVFLTFTLFNCNYSMFSSVYINDVIESAKATKYLISLGHRHIAFLAADVYNYSIAALRLEGYKRALIESGIAFDEGLIIMADTFEIEAGYRTVIERLKAKRDFTAIFAISDILAIGACRGIMESGLSVPEDISVMGFDGQDISRYYNPSITTIKQPVVDMAEKSVAQLFELMDGGTNRQEIFEANLVEGESCIRYRKNARIKAKASGGSM